MPISISLLVVVVGFNIINDDGKQDAAVNALVLAIAGSSSSHAGITSVPIAACLWRCTVRFGLVVRRLAAPATISQSKIIHLVAFTHCRLIVLYACRVARMTTQYGTQNSSGVAVYSKSIVPVPVACWVTSKPSILLLNERCVWMDAKMESNRIGEDGGDDGDGDDTSDRM
mmetsp:Transcript_20636/g.58726  ORF Transcript_20636/g.58726 Transcript_20636/m.58726 type:complete len:171 (+) Transcript_20636:100-612(+)